MCVKVGDPGKDPLEIYTSKNHCKPDGPPLSGHWYRLAYHCQLLTAHCKWDRLDKAIKTAIITRGLNSLDVIEWMREIFGQEKLQTSILPGMPRSKPEPKNVCGQEEIAQRVTSVQVTCDFEGQIQVYALHQPQLELTTIA